MDQWVDSYCLCDWQGESMVILDLNQGIWDTDSVEVYLLNITLYNWNCKLEVLFQTIYTSYGQAIDNVTVK